jgi:hypothetical protein
LGSAALRVLSRPTFFDFSRRTKEPELKRVDEVTGFHEGGEAGASQGRCVPKRELRNESFSE